MENLYETDEHAWLAEQVSLLEDSKLTEIDRVNLMTYLNEMAGRDRRELGNRFVVLVQHILKCHFQSDRKSANWISPILEQQNQITDMFADMPSIKQYVPELFDKAYPRAVQKASVETGLSATKFPATCPWTIDDCLAFDPTASHA